MLKRLIIAISLMLLLAPIARRRRPQARAAYHRRVPVAARR